MQDAAFRAFQKQFFQALRDRPLDVNQAEDAALYEPLHQGASDPVVRLHDTIDFSVGESVQLVAGFRGTGKTTEFSRLEKRLWESDHLVVRVDLDHFLDLNSAVDITDFLLVLSGAIAETLVDERLLGVEQARSLDFWDRAKRVFKPVLQGVDTELDAGPLSLQVGLRVDQALRSRVREALAGQLPRLVHEVRSHHLDVLEALRQKWGYDASLVVIVDSLEHIRGTQANADEVRRSVQALFFGHAKHLQLPDTHMVLSVPAFLAMQADNLAARFVNGAVQSWTSVQVRQRDGTPNPEGVKALRRLVERRGDWRQLLPDDASLERLILGSGGYLRDLLNMLIEAIHQAGNGVSPDQAERIMAVIRRSYQPLYADEVGVLEKIARRRGLQEVTMKDREYLLRFLDAHLVLCYLDQGFWYDVHPLVRDQVLGS